MINLEVIVVMPNGQRLPAGEMAITEPNQQGVCTGQFRYLESYLNLEDAFPLDPVRLPLSNQIFTAQRKEGVFAVFEDSLPDSWGRRLVIRHYNLSRSKQNVANLLKVVGENTVGAIRFKHEDFIEHSQPLLVGDLSTLLEQAERFQQQPDCDNELIRQLMLAGSSSGGARPKVLVNDDLEQYIAKFPAITDVYDVVGLEAVCMQMAQKAGLNVAETKLITVSTKKVLLVKRFDITESGGYNHMISMQTLLGVEGYYHSTYKDLAEMIRRWSDNCDGDLKMLYRQMVFNVMIGNTDDHLKNFIMMHTGGGWRLSPAYDLVPDIGRMREHTLMFDNSNYPPSDIDELIKMGRIFNIKSRDCALEVIEQCGMALREAEELMIEYSVDLHSREVFLHDFGNKLKRYGLNT